MNIFSRYEARMRAIAQELQTEGLLASGLDLSAITVEPPRDASHGDLATNAALVLARPARMKPRELAEVFTARLARDEGIEAVEIAGPGFINLRLRERVWFELLGEIVLAGPAYGRENLGQGERVNLEYVSANPTGPMHVGHCRGAVFGDALANLLAFSGYSVTREYYINDAGAQVDVLARSAYLRYREALGEEIGDIPSGLYPGDYLVPVGKALKKAHRKRLLSMDEQDWLPIVREAAVAMMMEMIRADLAALGIAHDVFFSERALGAGEPSAIAQTIAELKARDLVYLGRLPPPKGKLPDDWEDREQLLFRATDFGDDVDRALVKADGTHTYFAADMAYHRDKFRRGFRNMINVWGADHAGYIKRMDAAVRALTSGAAELDVKVCQIVRLFRGGEPVKMSKRAGTYVTLRELVDEVGRDPVRFMMLFRKNDAQLDFDFLKVTEQSKDNPVFYVQYAHARIHSVFRNLAIAFNDFKLDREDLARQDLSVLDDEAELGLLKRLAHYPRIVAQATQAHEPHRIAFFLHEVASDFHTLWNRGKESPHLRFIVESNQNVTMARAALLLAVADVLHSGLGILGVDAVTEMR